MEVSALDYDMLISIHAPQWGATGEYAECSSWDVFQSTHPSGVRPVARGLRARHSINFNPRTPVGCDAIIVDRHHGRRISIHAPQWGATGLDYTPLALSPISIHAPQWGATWASLAAAMRVDISIHAPQWGATLRLIEQRRKVTFQSTHPSGVRHNPNNITAPAALFQSTHPSGVRRATKA